MSVLIKSFYWRMSSIGNIDSREQLYSNRLYLKERALDRILLIDWDFFRNENFIEEESYLVLFLPKEESDFERKEKYKVPKTMLYVVTMMGQ